MVAVPRHHIGEGLVFGAPSSARDLAADLIQAGVGGLGECVDGGGQVLRDVAQRTGSALICLPLLGEALQNLRSALARSFAFVVCIRGQRRKRWLIVSRGREPSVLRCSTASHRASAEVLRQHARRRGRPVELRRSAIVEAVIDVLCRRRAHSPGYAESAPAAPLDARHTPMR
jgi:hypothetical protein